MKCFAGLCLLILVGTAVPVVDSSRILCLFPFNGKSHFRLFEPLCKGLAKRGHRVDMISHFPSAAARPNYTDIVDLSDTMDRLYSTFNVDIAKTFRGVYDIAMVYGIKYCSLMAHPKMKNFIENPPKDPPYDLIITEYFGFPCYLAVGKRLNVPVAVSISSLEYPFMDEFIGNPLSSSFFPNTFVNSAELDGFWDRLMNFASGVAYARLFNYYTSGQTEESRKYLGEDVGSVRENEKDVSLMLVNTHFSFHGIRPLTPALIEIGGLHIEEDEAELNEDLKKWLDSAESGLVYFTLGSLVNIETFPERTLLDLYKSFAKISPAKVLMRIWEKEKLPAGLPENVMTSPWIPQIPVLGHRNTRVFISHGGLLSSLEAVYHGVPVIGIPLFADQIRNVDILVRKRMAIKMNFDNITGREMDEALSSLLHDPRYRSAAKIESARFKDRPMRAMDTANYWIEYIIRNGPRSLRSPAVDLSWWQVNLIDIFAFLTVVSVLFIYLLVGLLKLILKTIRWSNRAGTTDERKKDN